MSSRLDALAPFSARIRSLLHVVTNSYNGSLFFAPKLREPLRAGLWRSAPHQPSVPAVRGVRREHFGPSTAAPPLPVGQPAAGEALGGPRLSAQPRGCRW